jgi:hypothetical protein
VAVNWAVENQKRLEDAGHYVRRSGNGDYQRYQFTKRRLEELRERGPFRLVFIGDPAAPDDNYAIPYGVLATLLTPDALKTNSNDGRQYWALSIREGVVFVEGDADRTGLPVGEYRGVKKF